MSGILNVTSKAHFDTAIRREEWHTYDPYSSTRFDNSDEIRIPIHHQDVYTTPCDSYIVIEGKLTKPEVAPAAAVAAPAAITLANNGFAFLFDEIRYELFGIEIDKVKNVGVASTLKGYVSMRHDEKHKYETAGWNNSQIINDNGEFVVSIPLKLLLGFCEDFRHIIVNAKQELILVRARNDKNVYINATELNLTIFKIQWRIKHVYPSDEEKLHLLNVTNTNEPLTIPFRSWDLYEYPVLPISSKQVWSIKSTHQLETPRFVILAFQTDIKNKVEKDSSKFNHCNLINAKLYLNSECYPYENLNVNFDKNQFALLYEMYSEFQNCYYNSGGSSSSSSPLLNWENYKNNAPLIVINCSKQSEKIKSGPVDIRLEFETSTNFPDQTTAYCLILHDRITEYSPLTGIVNNL